MSCVSYGDATVCFPGPMRVVRRESCGVKWCFVCRKRVEFEFTLTDEIEPSYYNPIPSIHCVPKEHTNGDLFPGWVREWDEE